MPPNLKKCEEQALQLPPHDRAILAEHLIASLDELNAAENERVWVEEAERRYQAYKEGEITARSVEEAIRDVRARIK